MPLSFIIVWNAKKKCICQNHLEILSPNAAAALDWNNLRQAVSKSPFSSSFSRAGDSSCDPQKSFYPWGVNYTRHKRTFDDFLGKNMPGNLAGVAMRWNAINPCHQSTSGANPPPADRPGGPTVQVGSNPIHKREGILGRHAEIFDGSTFFADVHIA